MGTRTSIGMTAGILLLALAVAPADAAPKAKKNAAKPAKVKPTKIKPLKTRRIWNLEWHDDWKAAVLKNRFSKKAQRPIAHLRILGDLAAKT